MNKFDIDPDEIKFHLESKPKDIDEVLEKAEKLERLDFEDIAALLHIDPNPNNKDFSNLLETAKRIRSDILGNEINLVVPLYITNYCMNKCPYCAFYCNNYSKGRTRLTFDQYCKEIEYLTAKNFRTIELVFSDDPEIGIKEMTKYIEHLRNKLEQGEGGMIGLNSSPLSQEDYRSLKSMGLDIVLSWQETYHKRTYDELHKECVSKKDFQYRLGTQDRIYNSGIRNAGIGVLLGLYDFKFEVMALVQHGLFLREKFDRFPIVGIPRLKEASRTLFQPEQKYQVSDNQLKLITAIIRLALPYSHIFISTRENKDLIIDLLKAGGGSISAALCSVAPGYITHKKSELNQFEVFSYEPAEMEQILGNNKFIPTYDPPFFDHINLKSLIPEIFKGNAALFIGSGLTSTVTDYTRNSSIFKKIADILTIKNIIIANCDSILEDTIKHRRGRINLIQEDKDMLEMESDTNVYKIHSSFDPLMFNKLEELFFTRTILFVGYNINDDNINAIIKKTKRRLENRVQYYAIMRDPTEVELRFWKSNNAIIFNVDIEPFFDILTEKLRTDPIINRYTFNALWEVRKQMEMSSVSLAARYRGIRDIEALETILERFKEALQDEKTRETGIFWGYDFDFHVGISLASGNSSFYDICRLLYRSLSTLSRQAQSKETLKQHEEILDAIKNKDEERAVKHMEDHIDYVREIWERGLNPR
ncbi:FCD domain-containing protein [Candidatus Methanoperedens nitratireducens]|nr:FCD domain-containing protein [Candidatus Methanoperedens nitroreducens]